MYSSNVIVINVHIIFLYLANIKHFETVVLIKVKSGFPTSLLAQKYKLTKLKN